MGDFYDQRVTAITSDPARIGFRPAGTRATISVSEGGPKSQAEVNKGAATHIDARTAHIAVGNGEATESPTPAVASSHSGPFSRIPPPKPKSNPLRFRPTAPVALFTAQLLPE